MSGKQEERLVCICPQPVVGEVLTYGDVKLLEQCNLCHKVYRQPCPKCASWTRNLFEHNKVDHKVPRKPKETTVTKGKNKNGNTPNRT